MEKELKFIFVGKAKDFNAFNITIQTVKKFKEVNYEASSCKNRQ